MTDADDAGAGLPEASRLFEAHLTVADLQRSVAFYRDVVGLPLALEVPERGAAFFWIGDPGDSMLGLWSLGSAPVAILSHIAFRTSLEEVLAACGTLRSAGITPRSFFGTETTEPSVIGWMPAAAVYLLDPDGHQLEYLAMLDAPARPERGIVTWSEWAATVRDEVRVERYEGARDELRGLFEEAEDSAAQLDSYLELGQVLVARAGDRVVGHLQLVETVDPEQIEIRNMAVERSHRRYGIGRALIAEAVELARARRGSRVAVATAAADIGNLRFYQRAGFRLRSVERDAFTAASGYMPGTVIDGVELRDRVWLDLDVAAQARACGGDDGKA